MIDKVPDLTRLIGRLIAKKYVIRSECLKTTITIIINNYCRPTKITLSDANKNRDSCFFASLYLNLHMHYKSYLLEHSSPIAR